MVESFLFFSSLLPVFLSNQTKRTDQNAEAQSTFTKAPKRHCSEDQRRKRLINPRKTIEYEEQKQSNKRISSYEKIFEFSGENERASPSKFSCGLNQKEKARYMKDRKVL